MNVEEEKYMFATYNLILNLLDKNYKEVFLKEKDNKEILRRKSVESISEIMAKSITNSFLNY